MTKLTQKNVKFDWSEKAEAAFQLLKQKLCSSPILALPEGSENFVVYCDASRKGLGAVLMQREKVIAYASCQPKIHEKNYTTHDLELGAVVFALKMWRHYLYGTKVMKTSCLTVKLLNKRNWAIVFDAKGEELNMRQRRWLELLSDYYYEIRYHPRKILEAQVEARKEENYETEDLCGMIKKLKQHTMGQRLCINGRIGYPCQGTLAYRLELPEQLSRVHSTFHVSNLKKCFVDEPLAIPLDEIQIDDKLHFIKEPVKIMD
ncbi:putative reverse transcriptase domain-containing protein [Tanacetum coccineum]